MSQGRKKVNGYVFTKFIQQVEIQNRMKEEQDMWKQHRKKDESKEKKVKKRKKRKRSTSVDSDKGESSAKKTAISSEDRWGHAGFVELYPDKVISGECFNSDSSNDSTVKAKKHKKMKKKKHKRSKKKKAS